MSSFLLKLLNSLEIVVEMRNLGIDVWVFKWFALFLIILLTFGTSAGAASAGAASSPSGAAAAAAWASSSDILHFGYFTHTHTTRNWMVKAETEKERRNQKIKNTDTYKREYNPAKREKAQKYFLVKQNLALSLFRTCTCILTWDFSSSFNTFRLFCTFLHSKIFFQVPFLSPASRKTPWNGLNFEESAKIKISLIFSLSLCVLLVLFGFYGFYR